MSSGNNSAKSFWEMDELRIISGAMVILSGATAPMIAGGIWMWVWASKQPKAA